MSVVHDHATALVVMPHQHGPAAMMQVAEEARRSISSSRLPLVADSDAVPLSDKLACLSAPASYPGQASPVEIVQTHMSFVFLTQRFAYKLKKPVRYDFLDFSTLAARKFDCEEEVRLNRRLAPSVYLGVVPLALADTGHLALDGAGVPVEWLVKMRRLPRHRMLDHAIATRAVRRDDVRRFARVLAAFYRRSSPIAIEPGQYRARFERDILANERELARDEYGVDRQALSGLASAQLGFVSRHAEDMEERVRAGRIIEGHGDLRPEHICLVRKPVFIDCLEFNRELRTVDAADELSYLALECEFAGAPHVGHEAFAQYVQCTGDSPPGALVHFYKAYRATLRAKIAAWHLADVMDGPGRYKWLDRALSYLQYAARYAALLSDA